MQYIYLKIAIIFIVGLEKKKTTETKCRKTFFVPKSAIPKEVWLSNLNTFAYVKTKKLPFDASVCLHLRGFFQSPAVLIFWHAKLFLEEDKASLITTLLSRQHHQPT